MPSRTPSYTWELQVGVIIIVVLTIIATILLDTKMLSQWKEEAGTGIISSHLASSSLLRWLL